MSQLHSDPPKKKNQIKYGVDWALHAGARPFLISHYYAYQRTTLNPISDIIKAPSTAETQELIVKWCSRKINEVNYVQVAGAVMFASVVSCLTWEVVKDTHWSGPALWYASILFALASIFSAAQLSLVLPEANVARTFNEEQVTAFKQSLADGNDATPSRTVLFAWQAPMMLLGHSVASYVVGLCVVVITPLARDHTWNASAKTVLFFLIIVLFICISAIITTNTVHKLKVDD